MHHAHFRSGFTDESTQKALFPNTIPFLSHNTSRSKGELYLEEEQRVASREEGRKEGREGGREDAPKLVTNHHIRPLRRVQLLLL